MFIIGPGTYYQTTSYILEPCITIAYTILQVYTIHGEISCLAEVCALSVLFYFCCDCSLNLVKPYD